MDLTRRAGLAWAVILWACGGPDTALKPAPNPPPPPPHRPAPIPLTCPQGATARRLHQRIFCETDAALHGPYEARQGGALVEEMTLINGLRQGAFKRAWPNGHARQQGHYEAGRRVGRWIAWDEQGRMWAQAEFGQGNALRCGWGDCAAAFPPEIYCALEDINDTLGAQASAVTACFQAAMARRPQAGGEVHIRWVIGLDGRARNVEVTKSRLDKEMSACLRQALRSWRFPKPAGGVCPVEHIFRFHQEF
ncbi:AgmX/PglI C-terminal domain-containing protein [Myxococcota bacterium]|nr:AgmX/PglI C-terminal domain-containing protein [Myxococcota bacterium]